LPTAKAMECVFVKTASWEAVPVTEETMRLCSRSGLGACSKAASAVKELVLTQPPHVRNNELDADEYMELSISWSRRSCASGGKVPFMVDVLVCNDQIEASSKSSADENGASQQNQAKKKRPSKGKCHRYRNLVHRLQEQISENPEGFTMDEVVPPQSLHNNGSQRLKLIERMVQYRQNVLTSRSN